MYTRHALIYSIYAFAAFPYRCTSSSAQSVGNEATISVDGGTQLLRNPGRKAKRHHEMVRGDILEQTSETTDFETVCASSALDMGETQEVVQFSQLESLTPYSDVSKKWLKYLQHSRRDSLIESSKTQHAGTHGMLEARSVDSSVDDRPQAPRVSLASLTIEEEAIARGKLTSWHCLQAHSSNFGEADIRMTCKFKNLYFQRLKGHDSFVAHTLNSDGLTALPKLSFGVSSDFRDMRYTIEMVYHNSLNDFVQTVLNTTALHDMPGLTLAFTPLYHFNVGHGLFDGLYPAFVSVLQHGEQGRPFRSLLVGDRLSEINDKCPMCYQHVEDIFSIISGVNTTSTADLIKKHPDAIHRFDETIIGIGTNSAKIDMNVNFSLGACRAIDACRAFRKRVFDFAGVSIRPSVSEQGPFKAGIVTNKRFAGWWDKMETWLHNESTTYLQRFQFEKVVWTPSEKQENAKISPDSVQLGDFRSHLKIISGLDVLISSPGTAMMYQTFLPDGAVLINMGDDEFSYMEEYMAEGSPYLRALYYPLRTTKTNVLFEKGQMRTLMLQAQGLLTDGFKHPTPVNQNLSPMGRFYKAFAYWKHQQVISLEMLAKDVPPQREFWDIDMLGNRFLGPNEFRNWCCHQNGTYAGVMHALAKAYQDADSHQSNYFQELLVKPPYSVQYNGDLKTYLKLSGLV